MYRYKVLISWEDEQKTFRESGFVAAHSYNEAVKKIVDNYGENDIVALQVDAYTDMIADCELQEEINVDYYKERKWGSIEPCLTL